MIIDFLTHKCCIYTRGEHLSDKLQHGYFRAIKGMKADEIILQNHKDQGLLKNSVLKLKYAFQMDLIIMLLNEFFK